MLVASPIALVAFIRFEARLSARGGDPLVALSLFRNGGFAIGLVMALFFYTLSSFYLTFAVYLQSGPTGRHWRRASPRCRSRWAISPVRSRHPMSCSAWACARRRWASRSRCSASAS